MDFTLRLSENRKRDMLKKIEKMNLLEKKKLENEHDKISYNPIITNIMLKPRWTVRLAPKRCAKGNNGGKCSLCFKKHFDTQAMHMFN